MPQTARLTRRRWLQACAGTAAAIAADRCVPAQSAQPPFRLRYILASAMYGYGDLEQVLPEVHKVGADAIDIWPKVHGNQREQVEAMGEDRFRQLLEQHQVKLGGIACYRLGPFALKDEMQFAARLGGPGVVLVTGAQGPRNLQGEELRQAVRTFAEKMKPQVAEAERQGCVIAIENHANSLIHSPDSIRWFGDMVDSPHLGLALAPHHLPQDAALIAGIAEELGSSVKFFYAQQHGKGSQVKLPKDEEMLQLPGRGPLDFGPILAALSKIGYQGYTEIFMHPVPRGVPILDSTEAITCEINRARDYLNSCLAD